MYYVPAANLLLPCNISRDYGARCVNARDRIVCMCTCVRLYVHEFDETDAATKKKNLILGYREI